LVNLAYKDVKPEEFDGLIIPGGRAPEYMRTYPELEVIVKHFFDANKPVAAIRHGPLVIVGYGLAKGRRMTCYMVVAPDLKQAGAIYVNQEVVVDGKQASYKSSVAGSTGVYEGILKTLKEVEVKLNRYPA